MKNHKYLVVLVGVCGTGKNSVGKKLAHRLEIPFFDANKIPVSKELPVSKLPQEENSEKWLTAVKELMVAHSTKNGCVISCSILKREHRKMIAADIDFPLDWIFMNGSYEYVAQNIDRIEGLDRPASLLKSDFETLEIPKKALTIDITNSEQESVDTILKYLARKYG